ncbi:ATP-dependent 6-phosphofructokinase 4, chloroplastic-like [Malus sylvestris]|uniref:ATP-dependent 6-phosphofructokinase 4, chloroplastic-like n=1 Tax=Malus sylvestris TaxID=3752 RepID=UPI0021AC7E56|nr:ATP-dependent 6-phosphofructokinase 4, chloroplastic-like [Malus sylvestris]
MGRHSGLISLYATLASRDVNLLSIWKAAVGFLNLLKSGLKNGHVVIVLAEGAGQEYVGLWLTKKIKDHFTKVPKMAINMKYIGFSGFTVGPVSSKHAYIPIARVTENQNKVSLTDRMWATLLAIDEPA